MWLTVNDAWAMANDGPWLPGDSEGMWLVNESREGGVAKQLEVWLNNEP